MDNDVTVRGVITREYVGVSESDTVQDTVELMREEQASSVIVLRGSDPVGIVTEWDVMGLVADGADPAVTAVSEIMSSPVRSVAADTPLVDAAGIMSSENIRNLLVEGSDTGAAVGALTDRDVIAAVASLQKSFGFATPGGTDTGTAPRRGSPTAEDAAGTVRDRAETASTGVNGNGEPDAYANQGVCETCGTLTDDLRQINGQLVCPDCQEI
jgi:CBS domain-containing protein